MQFLLTIEEERGRRRPSLRASRTLDLDLILYGDRVIDEPGLQCRIRASANGRSCWGRWRRWRRR